MASSASDASLDPYASPPSKSFFSSISTVYNRFSSWRSALGLPQPGNVENLQKEVKTTHLTNYLFDGARAELTKSLSVNPLFQVNHSFSLGSQTGPSSYNFGAVFASSSAFLQGGIDHDGNVNARFNHGWTPNNVTKLQALISSQPGHNTFQLEHDYQGQDYNINLKTLNPWLVDFTGIYVGSYLQSVTRNLALGFETLYQHPSPDLSEISASYVAKYIGNDRNWIATAHVQPAGVVQASYWQKLSEKVEFAADLQVLVAPIRRDALATLGVKYDLRLSTFRAQLDSAGKVSAFLEQRFTPAFSFLLSGEIDQFKNAAKIGVGVMIESSSLTPEEMGMPPQP